jgi:large subunit ribosomal protein L33
MLKKSLHFTNLFAIIQDVLKGGIIYMAKVGNRQRKTLVCTVCNEENYRTNKNVKNTTERLELSKFCSRCGKHTVHKEKK